MPYTIQISSAAFDELLAIKPFYRRRIVDSIDKQLVHEPNVETRNRKVLTGLQPDFEQDEPVWELRVGQHRVYYDVNDGRGSSGARKTAARDNGANHMKTVDAEQFAENVHQYLRDSLSEAIVVTDGGKPCAVVHGVDYDEEQMELVNSPEFWAMITKRRNEPTIPWETAKKQFEASDQ